jgi:hypothetical protein
MKRLFAISIICLLLRVASGRSQDIVEYYDPNSKAASKIEQIRGTIESENALGIKVHPRNAPVKEIHAADIRYIRYRAVAAAELDYRKPFGSEDRALGQTREELRKRLLAESLQGFRDLLSKAKESPAAERYIEYRIAASLALQATDDHDKLDPAIEAFVAFGKKHTDGWEIVAALKQLARLQEEKGNLAGTGEAFADLARVPGITQQLRQEAAILSARALYRAGRIDEGEKKLLTLDASLTDRDSAKPTVQIFLAQGRIARGDLANVEGAIRAALAKTTEPAVLAAAHNILGDYYLKKGQPEAAFWEYLHVDVQYGDDRDEEAKALYHLSQLFDKVKNDKVRAQDCLTRLQDKSAFAGTEYYKKATASKP